MAGFSVTRRGVADTASRLPKSAVNAVSRVVDVRDHGAKLDGTTDDSTAWFNALAAGVTQQRPVFHPGGVSVVSQAGAVLNGTSSGSYPAAVVLPLGCPGIVGNGIGGDVFSVADAGFVNGVGSVIRLKNGSNCDVVQTANFAALTGTTNGSVYTIPERFTIRDLVIDGNNTKVSGTNSSGSGLRIYGRAFRVTGVTVQNAAGIGVWSEGVGSYDMIAVWDRLVVVNGTSDGFTVNGPHDSSYGHIFVSKNDGNGISINPARTFTLGTEMFTNCHVWGNGGYNWILGASDCVFTNCVSDGTGLGTGIGALAPGGIRVYGNDNQWVGGQIYGTNVVGEYAIEYGDGTTTISPLRNQFITNFWNYKKGAMLVRHRANTTAINNRYRATMNGGGNTSYVAGEGYGTLNGSHTFPQATITLNQSTAAWTSSGTAYISDGTNVTTVAYAGISGSTLTGCTGGTGTFATGSVAFQLQANITANDYDVLDTGNATAGGLWSDVSITGYVKTFHNSVKFNQFATNAVFQGPTSGAITVNALNGGIQRIQMNGNVTGTTITNPVAGQTLTLSYEQNGVGGFTYVWPTGIKWAGGAAPAAGASTAAFRDCATFYYDGSNWIQVGPFLAAIH